MAEAAGVLEHVESSDGTRIAYRRSGEGPPLVLVHGTTSAHWSFRFLVPALVDSFTLYAIDRRGRGDSGDRADYAIEQEFEDVAAVVDSIEEPTPSSKTRAGKRKSSALAVPPSRPTSR